MDKLKDHRYEQFLRLFRANESRIFQFILTLLPNYSSAEDTMQDTMLVMWRKFDQFEAGTNFAAWGMQIARYNVFKFYRHEKSGVVHFDSNALETIIKQEKGLEDSEDVYLDALEECTKKLQEKSKKLISFRYADSMKVTDIALKMGSTINSTYKAMSRIHHYLLNCVEHKLLRWEKNT